VGRIDANGEWIRLHSVLRDALLRMLHSDDRFDLIARLRVSGPGGVSTLLLDASSIWDRGRELQGEEGVTSQR
jgi:hypothetical protein